jgi:putative nucleotidyltransferase with HDIG domain
VSKIETEVLSYRDPAMTAPAATTTAFAVCVEQARLGFGLPEEAQPLLAAVASDQDDGEPLVRWLSDHEAWAGRLLRWCNTPLYNLARPYPSLLEALTVLGGRELSRLALLTIVRDRFLPDRRIASYEREALWRHSIAVGAVAAMIARSCGDRDPSLVLVAGTLHDIGLCAGEQIDTPTFAEVVRQIDELTPTCQVERDLWGWDHAELGAEVLRQWGLPAEVQSAARHHHQAEAALDGPHAAAVSCVAIANYLCSRSGWVSLGRHNVQPPSDSVYRCLGIDAPLLKVLWQQLYPVLESVAELK